MHLNLQFAIFGSVLTIGAMVGAVTSGRLADFLGRKMVKSLRCQVSTEANFLSFTDDRRHISSVLTCVRPCGYQLLFVSSVGSPYIWPRFVRCG